MMYLVLDIIITHNYILSGTFILILLRRGSPNEFSITIYRKRPLRLYISCNQGEVDND